VGRRTVIVLCASLPSIGLCACGAFTGIGGGDDTSGTDASAVDSTTADAQGGMGTDAANDGGATMNDASAPIDATDAGTPDALSLIDANGIYQCPDPELVESDSGSQLNTFSMGCMPGNIATNATHFGVTCLELTCGTSGGIGGFSHVPLSASNGHQHFDAFFHVAFTTDYAHAFAYAPALLSGGVHLAFVRTATTVEIRPGLTGSAYATVTPMTMLADHTFELHVDETVQRIWVSVDGVQHDFAAPVAITNAAFYIGPDMALAATTGAGTATDCISGVYYYACE
jgi:hypothetical protein